MALQNIDQISQFVSVCHLIDVTRLMCDVMCLVGTHVTAYIAATFEQSQSQI